MQQNVPGDSGTAEPDDGGHVPNVPGPQPPAAKVPQDHRPRHFREPRHSEEGPEPGHESTAVERISSGAWAWGKEIVTILVIALVLSFLIKTFLFRAFYIPSGSMENTLQINDRIFVNLLVPEPFALKRGDVVVFKDTQGWLTQKPAVEGPFSWVGDVATFIGLAPDSSEQHLVKRVIGLPGDKVKCCTSEGKLSVNGEPITEPYLFPGAAPSDTTFEVTVPEGHMWVMGDHRNNSEDSRAHQAENGTGFVPIADVEGRAVVIAWPLSHFGILGNYPDVFKDVPAPQSTSQGSPSAVPAAK